MVTVIAIAVVIALALILRHLENKWTASMVAQTLIEAKRAFPDSCPICGFFRFGHREYGAPFDPPEHDCCEDWRPLEDRMSHAVLLRPSALTLEEAKERRVCRFCELGMEEGPGMPFLLNFGKEFCHKKCREDNLA